MRHPSAASVVAVVLLACSPGRTGGEQTTKGGALESPSLVTSTLAVVARLAKSDAALSHAVRATAPFAAESDGGFRAVGALSPHLPLDAASPRRLQAGGGALQLSLVGAAKTSGHLDDGALVYADAFPAVDDVLVSSSSRLEEVLLIRTAKAAHEFRWRVGTAGLRPRAMADGSGFFEDASGHAVLFVPAPYAIDAKGERRPARLTVDGDDMRIALDRVDESAYPLLLDPAFESYSWTNVTTTAGFVYNGNAPAIAYHEGIKKVMLVGGVTTLADAGKTWLRDSGAWTAIAGSSPPARTDPALAYDSTRGVVVMFGGYTSAAVQETWEFNGTTWSQKFPSGTLPPARSTHGMAYDANRKKTVMAGGSWGLSDTWEWDGTSWVNTIASGAPAVQKTSLVYDEKAKVVRLVGGLQPGTAGPLQNLLQYTGTAWTVTTPSTTDVPPKRYGAAVAYDSARGVTVVFGGWGVSSTLLNDTWEFDGSKWIQRSIATASIPAPYYFMHSAFDKARGRVNMIGATYMAAANSTWEYTAIGGACTSNAQCDTGYCVDGVCCQVASCGSCQVCSATATTAACVPVTSADDPDSCTGTKSCDSAGACKLKNGQTCAANTDCVSGACVDGVCCNSTCTGQCSACNVIGKVGTCSPVTGAPRGGRAACPTGATDPSCASTCNGTDGSKCNYPTATTSCGSATCSAGKETHVGTCNGSGGCDSTPKACAPYACSTTACFTSCTVDTNCSPGNYCKGGLCVPNEALGKPCTSATACGTLSCTDGFCCGSAACGTGSTCGFPGKEGTCVKVNGGSCTLGSDCGSGNCVDGVCCDTKCDGQCEACDVPDSTTGRPGKCIPVKGKPHGTRAACADGGGDLCAAASCDGSTTTSCAAFTGSDQTCRPQSCKDGVLTAKAVCDGLGACPAVITSKCDGFVCTQDGSACETSCVDDTRCMPGFLCKDGKCKPKTATCSEDGLSSKGDDGTVVPCAPYRCGTDGTCSTSCGTSNDCAPGSVCDTVAKTCSSAPGGETDDSGGCAFGDSRTSTAGWLSLVALVAALGRTSRRRRIDGRDRLEHLSLG